MIDHDMVAALTKAGFSALQIAHRLGVTDRTVFRSRRASGVSGRANIGGANSRTGRIDWSSRGWRAALMVWRDGWTAAAAGRRMRVAGPVVIVKVHRLRSCDVVPTPEAMAWRAPAPTRPKDTRQYTCSVCGIEGHQKATCKLRRRTS